MSRDDTGNGDRVTGAKNKWLGLLKDASGKVNRWLEDREHQDGEGVSPDAVTEERPAHTGPPPPRGQQPPSPARQPGNAEFHEPARPGRNPLDSDHLMVPPRKTADEPTSTSITGLRKRNDVGKGSPHHGVTQHEVNDTAYCERQGIVEMVEERYQKYGPTIATAILTRALMPNGVDLLLQKLDLKPTGRLLVDHDQIIQYIDFHGAEKFCQACGIRFDEQNYHREVAAYEREHPVVRHRPMEQANVTRGPVDPRAARKGTRPDTPMPRPNPSLPPSERAGGAGYTKPALRSSSRSNGKAPEIRPVRLDKKPGGGADQG